MVREGNGHLERPIPNLIASCHQRRRHIQINRPILAAPETHNYTQAYMREVVHISEPGTQGSLRRVEKRCHGASAKQAEDDIMRSFEWPIC